MHKDGAPCLVMESGDYSLDALIERREEACLGPFLPSQILKVCISVCLSMYQGCDYSGFVLFSGFSSPFLAVQHESVEK